MSEFNPMFTPYEMMELGIFDGKYYGENTEVTNRDFKTHPKITKTNLFMEGASQPLEVWQEAGWIKEHDPMGWFQWYVRYHHGRRIDEYDEWQMKRWKSFVARHSAQVRKNGNGDLSKRRKQRQALLHWGADPIPDVNMTREEKYHFLQNCHKTVKSLL